MKEVTPYRWQGNLYCGTHIVELLTSIQPWKEWTEDGNRPTGNPEQDLTQIALFFEIDRHDFEQVTRRGLPYPEAAAEGMCSVCLKFFT